ncbi:MAG: hypothetical protein JWN76_576 [Chitinophagaceae bacterium]|nr:hypothetical protein [Chitinophagaceae bacterium]
MKKLMSFLIFICALPVAYPQHLFTMRGKINGIRNSKTIYIITDTTYSALVNNDGTFNIKVVTAW